MVALFARRVTASGRRASGRADRQHVPQFRIGRGLIVHGVGDLGPECRAELEPEAMQLVEAYFMNAEAKPSIPGYMPAVLLIDDARKFSHRDDPDYWQNF